MMPRMDIRQLTDCVGGTPLIRLNRVSEQTGCEILGKAEFMNPGGSVKDRAALGMVLAARESGELRPGGTIVEGTAGNTGIGLAMVGSALGHRTIIVMPENQSKEKIDSLELLGADLHLVPATSYSDPAHYIHTAERLAQKLAEREEMAEGEEGEGEAAGDEVGRAGRERRVHAGRPRRVRAQAQRGQR